MEKLLKNLGLSIKLKGYLYLKDSILLIKDYNINEIYLILSKKYLVSPKTIERSIRYTIEVLFLKGNIKLLQEIFIYCNDRPSNKTFILTIYEIIHNNDLFL